ncbi:O-methyltransferase [Pseudomonas sp. GM102]|jgi:SAM-dependent methyltransferase|uniref:methyltransferase n=1 Tax=unclassified Pseudomonas TaxID=196821 RepID=UPI00026F5E48|nr:MULTISPECIES: methyltransferase [unclassified Pseudomonas]EJL95559.1 O-methyltransferase [Pseudomonas sp. GM102]EJM67111.1 O-methyltransferase [Pseudomonas sp. GM50]
MNDINLASPHPLQPYWDLTLAGVRADALRIALDWKLFNLLQVPTSALAIARQLQLDPANTGYWLEVLWSMELLKRDDRQPPHYRNTAVASDYLRADAADYCGDAWAFRLRGLRHFGSQLGDQVRTGQLSGQAPNMATTIDNWTMAARLQIAQEQRAVTVDVALRLMAQVPEFPAVRRMLDLGGGPGLVAIALARDNPMLTGEVFDFAQTVTVAADNIRLAGLEQRLEVRGGDLASDPIGEGYDLIWCSSVLHFVPDMAAALAKIHAALRPGGVLVSAHAEIPADPELARRVMAYYLSMQMQGRQVTCAGGLSEALQQAGFVNIDSYPEVAFAMTPVSVLVARRSAS